jgi:hypothetical protein
MAWTQYFTMAKELKYEWSTPSPGFHDIDQSSNGDRTKRKRKERPKELDKFLLSIGSDKRNLSSPASS